MDIDDTILKADGAQAFAEIVKTSQMDKNSMPENAAVKSTTQNPFDEEVDFYVGNKTQSWVN